MRRRLNDSVHFYMNELTSRIIAESGISTDRYHLGKILLQSFRDAPESVLQIDGATGESETFESALQKSIRCAISLRNLGLEKGDVMVLMAPNHLNLAIPFYAALYLGIAMSAIDINLGVNELQDFFRITKPKVIFCQSKKVPDIQFVLQKLAMDLHIITFDRNENVCNFIDFIEKSKGEEVEKFKPSNFDPESTIALLISTSGTTGVSKSAAVTHKHFSITVPYLWAGFSFPTPTRMTLVLAPLQWLSSLAVFVFSAISRCVRLQTSLPLTQEHIYHLINTYKPSYTIISPTLMANLARPEDRDKCNFTCLETILIGGSVVPIELVNELKKIMPKTDIVNAYGISEISSLGFHGDPTMPVACGKPLGCFQYRLIDIKTGDDIYKSNLPGELWLKGISFSFKRYYNNEKANEEAFTSDDWFKTGDIFYVDENGYYFFVERLKMMLKYKSYQISPVEVETVIRQHLGVSDVAVSSIPDLECGDLLVACVVLRKGYNVTAQELKDLVKKSLSETKELRGGVIFVQEIPITATTKVDRRKLKELVLIMDRE